MDYRLYVNYGDAVSNLEVLFVSFTSVIQCQLIKADNLFAYGYCFLIFISLDNDLERELTHKKIFHVFTTDIFVETLETLITQAKNRLRTMSSSRKAFLR